MTKFDKWAILLVLAVAIYMAKDEDLKKALRQVSTRIYIDREGD